MERYYKERLEIQKRLIQKIAPISEVDEIIEMVRGELRTLVTNAMEVCILLLDPEAETYTRPLGCALYSTPVDCQACKRDRPAVQKATSRKKVVVTRQSQPIKRKDDSLVAVGSECAVPVFVENDILAVISVVIQPMTRFSRYDFFLLKDIAEILGTFILKAKRQWEITREKIRINRKLIQLSPFVPESVRNIADKNPERLVQDKVKQEVTVLFLDLEGYTSLSIEKTEAEVNALIERIFSSFVDPIYRSHGEINETAGDGLMILFKNHDPVTNAVNSVKAAFEIREQSRIINRSLQKNMAPIAVNIGINSGSALVGMTRFKGSLSTRMTFTATGTVTNIAARLSDHAKGGDIIIGKETYEMIKRMWPTHDRGCVQLKGIEAPLYIYSMLGPSSPNQIQNGPT